MRDVHKIIKVYFNPHPCPPLFTGRQVQVGEGDEKIPRK